MKILVLGGGGFIGSHLCDSLLLAGHQVRVFEYPGVRPLGMPDVLHQIEWVEGDFTNPVQVDNAVRGCEVIYHLISTTLPQSSNDNPVYDVETNVIATVQLLQSARHYQVRKIIFTSSGGTVYGIPRQIPIDEEHPTNPVTSYGIGKLAIEKYLHLFYTLYGLDYCVLRLANPYGERQRAAASQGAIAVFLNKLLRGEPVEIWGDGSVVRDYIHIADAVDALLATLEQSSDEHIVNIGSGSGRSLNEVIDTIENVIGMVADRRYLPGRVFDVPVSVLSIERAQRVLNWSPKMSFDQGLARFAEWLQKT